MNMGYVLANEIERRHCRSCGAIWIRFNHEGHHALYRLGFDAPENCATCGPFDRRMTEDSIVTFEEWVQV
jgi:hypothetical protein